MGDSVLMAIIGGNGTLQVALASSLLVYRGFNSIERRLEVIESDIRRCSAVQPGTKPRSGY
jgi:hypothetical protein